MVLSLGRRSTEGGIRWRTVLLDVVVVAIWVAVVSVAWRSLPWPSLAYYAVVFGGILGYSLLVVPAIEAVSDER